MQRRLIYSMPVLGFLILISGCAGNPPELTASGTVDTSAERGALEGETCSGLNSGLGPSVQVIITNAIGDTIGATSLEEGVVVDYGTAVACQFVWTAGGLPSGEEFYEVAVGDIGSMTIPEAELSELITMTAG